MKYATTLRNLFLTMIVFFTVITGHSQNPFYNSKQFRLYSWDQNLATNAWMRSTSGSSPWGIAFWVENQERLTIEPSGKVGIGDINPTHMLSVGSLDEKAVRLLGPYGVNGYGCRINFGAYDNTYIGEDGDFALTIRSPNSLTVKGRGTAGTIKCLPELTNGESGVGFFQNTDGSGIPWVISQGGWGNTGKLVFGYNNPRVVIQQDGNVGIGIVSPQAPLDVNGGGRLNGTYLIGSDITRFNNIPVARKGLFSLWVEKGVVANDFAVGAPTTWADHVFAPTYSLHSLQEVETFIKANHHLPDMPSESEIKKDGYTLHDMNTRLLQKIEELTLYVIEQQKEIDALKKQMRSRRKKGGTFK